MRRDRQCERNAVHLPAASAAHDQRVIAHRRVETGRDRHHSRTRRNHRAWDDAAGRTSWQAVKRQCHRFRRPLRAGHDHRGGNGLALCSALRRRAYAQGKVRMGRDRQRERIAVHLPAAGAGHDQRVIAHGRVEGCRDRYHGRARRNHRARDDASEGTVWQTTNCQRHRLGRPLRAGHGHRIRHALTLSDGLCGRAHSQQEVWMRCDRQREHSAVHFPAAGTGHDQRVIAQSRVEDGRDRHHSRPRRNHRARHDVPSRTVW